MPARYIISEDTSINKYLEIIYNILQDYATLNAGDTTVNPNFFSNYCSSTTVLKSKLSYSSGDANTDQIFRITSTTSGRTIVGTTTTSTANDITFDNDNDELKIDDCYVYYETTGGNVYYNINKLDQVGASKKIAITADNYFEYFIKYQIIKFIKTKNYKKKELKEASIKNNLQIHLRTFNYVDGDYDSYVKPILDILENINEYIFEKYEVVIECLYNYYLMVLLEENILYLESQDSYWSDGYFKNDDTNLDNLIVSYSSISDKGIETTLVYAIAYLLNNYDLSSNYYKINNVLKNDFFAKIFNLYGHSSINSSTGADINILIYEQETITDPNLINQYTYVEAITADTLLNDTPAGHDNSDTEDLDGYYKLILHVIRKEAENNFTNYTNLTDGDLLNILKYIDFSGVSSTETTVENITDFSDITDLDTLITAEFGSDLTKLDALRTYAKSWGTAVKITDSFDGSFDPITFCSITDLKKAKLGSATKKIEFLLLCTLCVIKNNISFIYNDNTNEVIKLYNNFKLVNNGEDIFQSVPTRKPSIFTFLDCAILTGETLLNKHNTADNIVTSFKQKIAEYIYSLTTLETSSIDFKTICSYISFTFDTASDKITFTVKTHNQYPILLVPITTTAKFNVLQLNTNTLTDLPKCYGHLSRLKSTGMPENNNDIEVFLTIESTTFNDICSDALLTPPQSSVATYTKGTIEPLISSTITYITAIKTKYSNAKNISDVKNTLNAKLDSLIVSSDYNVDSTTTATGINATKKALSKANDSYKENVDKYKTKNNELNNILKNNLYNNIFLYITIVVLILICLGLIYINNHKASLKTQYSVMLIAFLLLYYIIYTNVTVNITETFYSTQTTQQKFITLHTNIYKYLLSLNSSEKIYGEALDKEKNKYDGFAKSSNSKLNSLELVLNDEFINAIKSKELVKFLILFTAICIISYIVYTNTEDPTTTSIIFIILFVIILAIYFYNINLMTRTKADTKYWNHRMVMK